MQYKRNNIVMQLYIYYFSLLILKNNMLPQKKQAMYNDDLAGKPQPKREVDNARKEIVASAKKLEESGEVNLADILGGGEMVE